MLLKDKTAVIYGGGGAIGGAVARAFAREGAKVYLTGRTLEPLNAVAKDISAAGGFADVQRVDALDEAQVVKHARPIAEKSGIDIAFNAVGAPSDTNPDRMDVRINAQGKPFTEESVDEIMVRPMMWLRTQLITARAVAQHMIKRHTGVIMTLSTTPARRAFSLLGGFGMACAAVEGLFRTFAADLGPHNVRAVCLRSTGSPEKGEMPLAVSHVARSLGHRPEDVIEQLGNMTLLRRLTTLAEVGNAASLIASDLASAMTGVVADFACGLTTE